MLKPLTSNVFRHSRSSSCARPNSSPKTSSTPFVDERPVGARAVRAAPSAQGSGATGPGRHDSGECLDVVTSLSSWVWARCAHHWDACTGFESCAKCDLKTFRAGRCTYNMRGAFHPESQTPSLHAPHTVGRPPPSLPSLRRGPGGTSFSAASPLPPSDGEPPEEQQKHRSMSRLVVFFRSTKHSP